MSAAQEIRNLIAGRPGSVNAFLARWGKLVVDYASAILPDRADPFGKMVEDILVDAISQARAIGRAQTDDEVRAFVVECALRTIRARYRDHLDARSTPEKATNSYTVEEIVARTSMTAEDITRGISEGRLRAVRADNTMRVKGDDVPGLGARRNVAAYHVSAAERELLCLHYRMNMSPEQISRISGSAPAHLENLIQTAAMRIAEADARKRGSGPAPEDTEMRRYIDGRLSDDETSRFERRVVKDKAAQQRLEELRSQRDAIRELFDSLPYDLSRVAVNVRERNPHQPVAVPPAAALWVQVVGVAALMLLLHRVGAYLPPADVRVTGVEGQVQVDDRATGPTLQGSRLVAGQSIETGEGGQAAISIDGSNLARLAGGSRLAVGEPRASIRQVLILHRGEMWAQFASSGHAFAVAIADTDLEVTGESGAEFNLALGSHANTALPDNLHHEQAAALVATFTSDKGRLAAKRAFHALAGYQVGADGAGVLAGDVPVELDRVPLDDAAIYLRALLALPEGETATLRLRRNSEFVSLPLRRTSPAAIAVLRVIRGSVTLTSGTSTPEQINRGQWALKLEGQPLLVGQRGAEDYQLLRMDASRRFKDRLHWLDTEGFPLRAENNLLSLDRKLRELAQRLERLRASEVQRDGNAEITRFEEIMQGTIRSAADRVSRGQGLPRDLTPGSLSDEELIKAEAELLGTIAHWRRQGGAAGWATLGSAGKTLHGRIQRDRDDMVAREADLTQGLLLLDQVEKLQAAIDAQQAEIDKLHASQLFDGDGARRKALDDQIAGRQGAIKAGSEAAARMEVLTLRLNQLDQQLDDLRRKLPAARGEVAAAELALAEIDKQLTENPYTAAKLTKSETDAAETAAALTSATSKLAEADKKMANADSALAQSRTRLSNAERDAIAPVAARDRAQDILTDAVADRTTAANDVTEKQAAVTAAQAALDALPEGDPGREPAQVALDDAKAALKSSEATLEAAKAAADAAKKDYDAAQDKASPAEAAVAAAKTAVTDAEAARVAAQSARESADKTLVEATAADRAAQSALVAMREAKQAREALDKKRVQTVSALDSANKALAALEAEIATADKAAEPQRAKLAEEKQLVDAASEARQAIAGWKLSRDQHQALHDEIALRNRELSQLKEERDRVAGSNFVRNYDRTLEEFRQFSARVDALEFLRVRALLEDQNFALAQKAAQDRYRETAQAVTAQAVALLESACFPYRGFNLADTEADAALIRGRLLLALWHLYYEPGADGATDGNAALCYYVAVQSGSGADALRALDDRWKLALAQVFDKARYEAATRLKPTDLAARKE